MNSGLGRACPHCGGDRPEHLIPRNYLCPACTDRATHVMGRKVRMFNGFEDQADRISASGRGAEHEDGSLCREVAERGIAYVDGAAYQAGEGRFGGTCMWPLASPAPAAKETEPHPDEMELYWQGATLALAEDIEWLKDGDFVLVEYGESTEDACAPYAQVALDEEGYWCEIVSNDYLPGDTWPLHGDVLKAAGWNAPDTSCPNWSSMRTGPQLTAGEVLAGLRHGRSCPDVRQLSWHVATAPPEL
ncbi:TY-Chap domain-containing protein [Arthrobacter crystallopoietes]|uniref:TY-Chap domain-containing protein n=1 Tax=Crystallibacter crystallopoietes TaxID=37928 RepID=UPI001ABE7DB4|nr:hypothetical protein [Arthrobacter crystallopoietes]QTG82579.1 hypothetical protein J5251_08665 [Arthrobacter crystallopoietes]